MAVFCAVHYNNHLTYVYIPGSVQEIGKYAFERCDGLTRAVMGDGVTEIPNQCFSSCKALEEVVIPDSVQKIGEHAFTWCGLSSIRVPENATVDETSFDEGVEITH